MPLVLPSGDDSGFIQNGPDGVRIVDEAGFHADAVAYGAGPIMGVTEGDADAPTEPGAHDESIGRCPDGADNDQNGNDFHVLRATTPGAANACPQM
jgi:hypothetical protein